MQLHNFVIPMTVGIVAGLLTRVLLTQTSYRQFPSKPHGMIIHVFLGFVASLLGALIVPAILKPDFTAGVFVSIGTAQFHTMRSLERESWKDLDKGEIVPRGPAFIEGMAVSFESRIFLVIAVSALTTVFSYFFGWPVGIACGLVLAIVTRLWRQGRSVGDIATVDLAGVQLQQGSLLVDGEEMYHVTTPDEELPTEDLIGLVVKPNNMSGVLTLAHQGQQQVILHNVAVMLGVQTHPHFKPVVTYYPKDRKLVIAVLAVFADEETALKAVKGAPVLEAVYRKQMVKV